MHACARCGSEYTSPLSAVICEEEDAEQDQNTRGWAKRYDFHRKD